MKFGIKVETVDGPIAAKLTCGDGAEFTAYVDACQYEKDRILRHVHVDDAAFCWGVWCTLQHIGLNQKSGTGLYDFYYLAALQLISTTHEVIWPKPDTDPYVNPVEQKNRILRH